jgi:hypothetical protein
MMTPTHHEKENGPFFIFSCGRSGSSLLSRMLNHHPRMAVPPESHLFDTFYPWLRFYGDLEKQKNRERLVDDILFTDMMKAWSPPLDRSRVLSLIRLNTFGGIFDAIMRTWAVSHEKVRWGEKTPKHLLFWREIWSSFPEAKFIIVIRDGRDVALSYLKSPFGPKTVFAAANRWVDYQRRIEEIRRFIPKEARHEVRYETLLEKPEEVLSCLCEFLGEAYDFTMMSYHKNPEPYDTDPVNLENLKKPVIADNRELWRVRMSKNHIRIFEAVAGDTLTKYGYRMASKNPAMSRAEVFCRRFVENPSRKAFAMARNRKGQISALVRMQILGRLRFIDPFFKR